MAAKKTTGKKQPASAKSPSGKSEPLEHLTPSQRANRLGKGRGKSGSDGSSTEGRGTNH